MLTELTFPDMQLPDPVMQGPGHIHRRDDPEEVRNDVLRDGRRAFGDAVDAVRTVFTAIRAAVIAAVVWVYILLLPSQHATAHVAVAKVVDRVCGIVSFPVAVVSVVLRWCFEWLVILFLIGYFIRYGPTEVSPRKLWLKITRQFRADTTGAKIAWACAAAILFVVVRGWIRTYHIQTITHVDCDAILSNIPQDVCGVPGPGDSLCVRGLHKSLYFNRWFIHLASGRSATLMEQASICPDVITPRARFSHIEVMNGTNIVFIADSAAFCIQHWREVLDGKWVC